MQFVLQFSVTDHFRDGNVHPNHLPGVYFFYDFSPIKVSTEKWFAIMFLFVRLSTRYNNGHVLILHYLCIIMHENSF